MPFDKAKERERQIQHIMSSCVHFTGIQNDQCKAGVAYASVRVQPPKERTTYVSPYPCMGTDLDTCSKRQFPTREQAEAEEDENAKHVAEYLAKMKRGICGVCGSESTDWRQSGSCIYSDPCGHRVGQGDAKKFKESVLKIRAEVNE